MGSNTIITRDDDGSIKVHGTRLWAPAEHVTGRVAPMDHGLVGWTMDPAGAFGTSQPTPGSVSVARVNLGPKSRYSLSTLWVSVAAGGSGLRGCHLGVYEVAPDLSSAALVSASRDLSDQFAGQGEVAASLRQTVTLSGRPCWVLVGLLVAEASTAPTLRGAIAETLVNANLTGLAKRYGTVGSHQSRLPRSLTSAEVGNPGCAFWAAAG